MTVEGIRIREVIDGRCKMKYLSIVLGLGVLICVPLTAEAYYYGHARHKGYHHSYGYHHYGYKGGYGRHGYYYGKKYYGYPYHYRRSYDYSYGYGNHQKYHHLYTDEKGYTYFISPKYGTIYCDHPDRRQYHESAIAKNVKYYCGDKYLY